MCLDATAAVKSPILKDHTSLENNPRIELHNPNKPMLLIMEPAKSLGIKKTSRPQPVVGLMSVNTESKRTKIARKRRAIIIVNLY